MAINVSIWMAVGAMLVCLCMLSPMTLECCYVIPCVMVIVILTINGLYSVSSISILLPKHFSVLMFGGLWWIFDLLWKC